MGSSHVRANARKWPSKRALFCARFHLTAGGHTIEVMAEKGLSQRTAASSE